MMDFITAPAICGIVFFSIYKVFELLVRKRERLEIISKLSQNEQMSLPNINLDKPANTFISLRAGAILLGIGLGMVVGFILCSFFSSQGLLVDRGLYQLSSMLIGASTLLFSGVALLISFLVERRLTKK